MITVDERYLERPVTRSLAFKDFLEGDIVMAIARDSEGEIYAFQMFYPQNHTLQDLSNKDFVDAEWYKVYDLVPDESTAYGTDCRGGCE